MCPDEAPCSLCAVSTGIVQCRSEQMAYTAHSINSGMQFSAYATPSHFVQRGVYPKTHSVGCCDHCTAIAGIELAFSIRAPLVHFGAVVSDAPHHRAPCCATGQAQLRLGKPLRMKCRAALIPLFMRKSSLRTVGIVRATVPFHGSTTRRSRPRLSADRAGARALAPEL